MDPNTQPQVQASSQVVPGAEDRHSQSAAAYPNLNLSRDEYVIQAIGRHPIGQLGIWMSMGFLSLIVLVGLVLYASSYADLSLRVHGLPSVPVMTIPAVLLWIIFGAIAWVSKVVYSGNRIYLTNESIIQHVQTGLFATKNEQLNLVKVEDVTVTQNGILPKMLDYGTVEIDTMDSGDSHVLTLVRSPQTAANAIHNAAEQAISRDPEANRPSTGPATA